MEPYDVHAKPEDPAASDELARLMQDPEWRAMFWDAWAHENEAAAGTAG
jgi:hypothetical protein